ncbi:nicotinate-nucleotide--dimethylbenzimidazole phosphoribosyltransferase [Streptomyces sp. NPDC052042]
MSDTGQIPGEGLPESAGTVEQPGIAAADDYTYLAPSEYVPEDDDLLLMPSPQGAWSDPQTVPAPGPYPDAATLHASVPAQGGHAAYPQAGGEAPTQPQGPLVQEPALTQQPVQASAQAPAPAPTPAPDAYVGQRPVAEPLPGAGHGTPGIGGHDTGSVDLGGVHIPAPTPPPAATPRPNPRAAARRPLHHGPITADGPSYGGPPTGGVVRSLADRGPAGAPQPQPVPQPQAPAPQAGPPVGGPEYLRVPGDGSSILPGPQLGQILPQGGTPWAAPAPQPSAAPVAADAVVPGTPVTEAAVAEAAAPEGATPESTAPAAVAPEAAVAEAAVADAGVAEASVEVAGVAEASVEVAGVAEAPVEVAGVAEGATPEAAAPEPVAETVAEPAPTAQPVPAAPEQAAGTETVSVPGTANGPETVSAPVVAEAAPEVVSAPVADAAVPEAVGAPVADTAPEVLTAAVAEAPAEERADAAGPAADAVADAADTDTVVSAENEAPSSAAPQAVVGMPGPVEAVEAAVAAAAEEEARPGAVEAAAGAAPVVPQVPTEGSVPVHPAPMPVGAEAVAAEPDGAAPAAEAVPAAPVEPASAEDGAVAPADPTHEAAQVPEADPTHEAAQVPEAAPTSEAAQVPEAVPTSEAAQAPEAVPTPEAAQASEPSPVLVHVEPAAETPDPVPAASEPARAAGADAEESAGAVASEPEPEAVPVAPEPAAETPDPVPAASEPGRAAGADAEESAGAVASEPEPEPVPAAPEPSGAPTGALSEEAVPAEQQPEPESHTGPGEVPQHPAEEAETPAATVSDEVTPAVSEAAAEPAPGTAAAPEAAAAPTTPPAPGYDDAEREAVLRVMRERRDIRNGFRSDPIPHEVLLRVLEAAHTAPSVGHSQPWDFVVIRSAETRRSMHELAQRQRDAYAKSLPKGRAKQFKELKIEAILDTPVNIVVTADPTRGGRHTLGRHTQPQMAPYSSALAVENLWLAARAEGLGVGWVSFFDEREMVRALGLPEHLEIVAYLCVGYVDEFPEEPELMQAGWSRRRPLSWVVHEETYGRRALPGEEPHDLLQETIANIRPLDAKALGEAWERQKRMTKPAGALGMLEIISAQLSGLSRVCPPPIPEPAAVAVFAGDHGVHAQGVTAWPQEVTGQMVANFLDGGAVCNAFAAQVGAEVCVVDVGVAMDLPATPGLLPRKVRPGTADFTTGPALTREEVLAAVEVGIETARDLVAAGNKGLLTGEMGIANTTASAALISVYTGTDPAEVTGRGTGITDEMHARKVDVVRRALELHQPDPADPIGVLAAVGGLEHAAMAGFLLGGASLRTPVILDGVSAGAAALVARAIAPEALAACIAGHRSAEPGHVAALNKLGLRPLVDLDLRLGEGTGALLALPIVQSAARAMHEVATFDAAGVTEK